LLNQHIIKNIYTVCNFIKNAIKVNILNKLSELIELHKLTVIALCLLISINAIAVENEDYYNRAFCKEMSGRAEYVLPDKSRVDCLTSAHAFEVGWAQGLKVYESIGQEFYYSAETGKQLGILLLIKRVIKTFNLPIKLIARDVQTN